MSGRVLAFATVLVAFVSLGIGTATAGKLPPAPGGGSVTESDVEAVLPIDTGTDSAVLIQGTGGVAAFTIGDSDDFIYLRDQKFRILSNEARYGGNFGASTGFSNYLNDTVNLLGEGYGLRLNTGANDVTTDEAGGAGVSAYTWDTTSSQDADGYLWTWKDATTAVVRVTNEGSLQWVNDGHPGISATPSLPTCDAGELGVLAPYDDTDDAVAGTACFCGTDGAGGYAWVSITGGTCP